MKFKKFKNAPIDLICRETSSQIFYKWIPISIYFKVMGHVNMLLRAMDHPPPTKMYMISTLQHGAFKDVEHQLHAWR